MGAKKEEGKEPKGKKRSTKKAAKLFFPEASGSTAFIDRGGKLSLPTMLQVVELLVSRLCPSPGSGGGPTVCSAFSTSSPTTMGIVEAVLNVCDTLLNMPSTHHQLLFDAMVSVVLRVFLHLGCPYGCSEGVRSQRADFLRLRLKSLLAQMHKGDPALFARILRTRIISLQYQPLMDTLHSITLFCNGNPDPTHDGQRRPPVGGADGARRRSSGSSTAAEHHYQQHHRPPPPTYRNNFNDGKGGMEAVCVSILLTPVVSKLMAKREELALPENMVIICGEGFLECIQLTIF